MISLVLPITVIAAVSAYHFPLTRQRISISNGETIFLRRCASCHALEGAAGGGIGPNLGRIGAEAGNRRGGQTAAEYLLESIVDPDAFRAPGATGEMPSNSAKGLGRGELLSLIAFLSSQGSRPDFRELLSLRTPAVVGGQPGPRVVDIDRIERGRVVFFEEAECGSCHSILPEPANDLQAPNLARAGQHSGPYLRESILDPSAVITPGYESVRVRKSDGRQLTGRLLRRSDSVVDLVPPGGAGILSLPLEDGTSAEVTIESQSAMPAFPLYDDDLEALVTFLATLGS